MLKLKAAVLFVAVALGGWHGLDGAQASGAAAQKKGAARRADAETLAQGKAVYVANCARCHGGDGAGRTTIGEMVSAPNLTDARWQERRSDNRMVASVARGRGQMPAFGKRLSKGEIASAIAYVRTLRK